MTSPPSGPGVVDALTVATLYGEEVLLHTVRDTHRAVAGRVFRSLGRVGRVPGTLHDSISSAVYAGLGVGITAAATALRAAGPGGPRLAPHVQSAINGVVGDRLRDETHALHFEMAVRARGADVPVDPEHLASAYPRPTGDLVVFLHGLCESEQVWNRAGGPTYPQALEREGWTPVLVRYSSGLGIRENGAALSSLLQDVVDGWPVEVRRIALVGHSMGGLVIRAACALDSEHSWAPRVTDVVFLGTPHLGAPLARQAMHGGRLLKLLPETAAFGRIIDHRSMGITDLEAGLDLPSLGHVRYRLVSGQLGGVGGLLLGDLLVRRSSAYGRSRTSELFPGADVVHLPNTHHFGLLNHPEVHHKLKEWLA